MTTDEMIAALEKIVAELDRRILNTTMTGVNRLWFRETQDTIGHIRLAIEYLKDLDGIAP